MEPLNATNATTPPTNSTPSASAVPSVIAASSTTVVHGMHIAAFVLLIAWAALY